jgi:hypothetical protein
MEYHSTRATRARERRRAILLPLMGAAAWLMFAVFLWGVF